MGRHFDFHDARVEGFDLRRGAFRARLAAALSPAFPAGYTLEGRFAQHEGLFWSATCLAA